MAQNKPKKEHLVLGSLLKKIAPNIGATILLEPEWNIVGRITFKSGQLSYFRYNSLDLNPIGSSDIARDKDYANFFIEQLGYPIVPDSKTFFSDSWAEAIGSPERTLDFAYEHAQKIGLPVVVKPNSGSQGVCVSFVHTKQDFYRAMRAIFKRDKVALIQKPVVGNDYRVVVLDNEVISAYQRIPFNVVGDGSSTIKQLIEKKAARFARDGRDFTLKLNDPRITTKLKRNKRALSSILARNEQLFLLDNANLSAGGESVDVTHCVHKDFASMAIKLTKDMGLRLCGVDLMIDGLISEPPTPKKWHILEINAAPGLDHYAKSGRAQKKIVEELYTKVLSRIEKK